MTENIEIEEIYSAVKSRARLSTNKNRLESILLLLAACFLFVFSISLTLSPSVRERSWDVTYRFDHWVAYLVWFVGFFIAHRSANRLIPRRDPYLIPIASLLSGWGILTIWRLFPYFGTRQTIWLGISIIILILGFRLNSQLNFLKRYKYIWLTSGLILTGLTLLFGTNPLGDGPRLWLGCCGVYLQPSEPLKLLLIIYLAAYFSDRTISTKSAERMRKNEKSNSNLIPLLAPTLFMTGLALMILLVQRDLGTASVFIILYAIIVYIALGKKRILAIGGLLLLTAGLIGYFAFDLIRIRVEAWINPWLDPSGRSYQIVQSLLAISNGGVFGRGPGLGNPGLVPIPHSDFIFSSIVEEFGLIGALGLLILIALIAQRGVNIAIKASSTFHRYLAAGLTFYIIFQSILIIGGNLRLLPLTGVTLPLVSYGGSSLLVSIVSLLILLHISNLTKEQDAVLSNPKPYQQLGALMLVGITSLAAVLGWWTIIRGPDLLTRSDNPRRGIADRTVRRGSIFDRDNTPINQSTGEPGALVRQYLYPELSPIVGYTNPIYGQSGLEASMDDTLRGLSGNTGISIWVNHLLFGQPPPGLDIRTSIDLELQQAIDELLKDKTGALVLINPQSGEILSMASHPGFDANYLEENWLELIQESEPRLVNRTTQGLFPLGTTLAPLLFASLSEGDDFIDMQTQFEVKGPHDLDQCAIHTNSTNLGDRVRNGCLDAYKFIIEMYDGNDLLSFLESAGIFSPPKVRLPVESYNIDLRESQTSSDISQDILVSPLQLALTLSSLSNGGNIQAPIFVTGINTPEDGWVLTPRSGDEVKLLPESGTKSMTNLLASSQLPIWETVSLIDKTQSTDQELSWYIAGTTDEWIGTPVVLVLLLENQEPITAIEIGHQVLETIFSIR